MEALIFKGKMNSTSEKDFTLKLRKSGEVGMVFRNKFFEKIAPHTGCFGYAIKDSRIYFCEFNPGEGYKFSINEKGDKGYVRFAGRDYDDLKDFASKHEGSYKIKYDNEFKHYCVETDLMFRGRGGKLS